MQIANLLRVYYRVLIAAVGRKRSPQFFSRRVLTIAGSPAIVTLLKLHVDHPWRD